jgi:tetratricopeptide (TPR) repeat protein
MRPPVCFLSIFMVITLLYLPASADESRTGRAIREYKAENYEEAIELLLKQKAESPSSMVSYYLGLSLKQAGDSKGAANNLRDAINDQPVPEAYPELIQVLYGMNEYKEAGDWIAKAEKEVINPPRIAFLKGLVLAKENRNGEAVASFNKARELDGSVTQAADFQIAMLYANERKISAARDSLKAVIAIDPSSEIASFAREYETAIKNLEDHKVWRLSASAAYQYDDNVVLKPAPDIPGVSITGEGDSGLVGVVKIDYAPLVSGPWFFNGQFNFYSDTYLHTPSHNIIAPSIVVNPGRNLQAGAVSLPLFYRHSLLNERKYEGMLSVRPTYTRIFSPGHMGQFTAGYARRDLFQSSIDRDENRDGDVYVVSAGYIQPFSGDKGSFNARYEFSRDMTSGRNWENTGNKIDLSVLAPLSDQVDLALSGEAFFQQYTNVHTIFGVRRRDPTYTGSANLIWQMSGMCNFNLQYSHTTVDSNISLYEYNRNIYTAGTECRF